jgi:anti-sigma factor RsiW
MNVRFFRFDDPAHREAAELLPWLVNETLDSEERLRVERHVAQCVACSRELDAQRALQAAIASTTPEPEAQAAFEQLRPKLDDPSSRRRGARGWYALRKFWSRLEPPTRRLMAAQLALTILLCVALAVALSSPRSAPSLYRTLSNPLHIAPAGPVVVVVFHADRSEHEIRSALLAVNGRIVDGPSSVGAYTVQLPAGDLQAALSALRSDPGVAFAEPIPRAGVPSR